MSSTKVVISGEDHVRQFSEDRDPVLVSITGTEYDLGMSYWEGHY